VTSFGRFLHSAIPTSLTSDHLMTLATSLAITPRNKACVHKADGVFGKDNFKFPADLCQTDIEDALFGHFVHSEIAPTVSRSSCRSFVFMRQSPAARSMRSYPLENLVSFGGYLASL